MVIKKDLMVISCLRQNARETLTQMSRRIRIPISTIYDRLKHQENNLIVKHTTLLDFAKLGFNTRVSLALKVKRESRTELEQFLSSHPSINSLYKINNGYDYLIDGVFRHMKDFQEFIEQMEENHPIIEKQIFYIVEDLRREAFLSEPANLQHCIKAIIDG
ncbi:MAG: Lrp/AsnC family transcriptional regulator [Nanoarchaeota archaeon]